MGRKIPGKKHRTIKDPEKQRALRINSLKHKVNAPPKDPDQQDVSKSLQRIINYKERLKNNGTMLWKPKKNGTNVSSDSIPSKPIAPVKRLGKPKEVTPNFKQNLGESDRSFLCRVNETVQTVLKESKFEDKYGVTIKRNVHTGEVEGVEKRPKDEIDDLMRAAKSKKKKNKKDTNVEPKLTKSQKKRNKILEKKQKKAMDKGMDFDDFKDKVEFGDIVNGPPTLTAPRKVYKDDCAPRPGRKDLLLKTVFKSSEKKEKNQLLTTTKTLNVTNKIFSDGKIDKTAKRKDLPNAIRRQLESHRNEAVNAYRILKSKQIKLTE